MLLVSLSGVVGLVARNLERLQVHGLGGHLCFKGILDWNLICTAQDLSFTALNHSAIVRNLKLRIWLASEDIRFARDWNERKANQNEQTFSETESDQEANLEKHLYGHHPNCKQNKIFQGQFDAMDEHLPRALKFDNGKPFVFSAAAEETEELSLSPYAAAECPHVAASVAFHRDLGRRQTFC